MIKLQKWTDARTWIGLPYKFSTREQADAFVLKLEAANPGEAFRVDPNPPAEG